MQRHTRVLAWESPRENPTPLDGARSPFSRLRARGNQCFWSVNYRHLHGTCFLRKLDPNGRRACWVEHIPAEMKKGSAHRSSARPVELRRVGVHGTAGVAVHIVADVHMQRGFILEVVAAA